MSFPLLPADFEQIARDWRAADHVRKRQILAMWGLSYEAAHDISTGEVTAHADLLARYPQLGEAPRLG